MNSASVTSIGASFERIAGVFAERRRQGQPSHGGATAFPFFHECLGREASVLRDEGQGQLADALTALGAEIEAMDNG